MKAWIALIVASGVPLVMTAILARASGLRIERFFTALVGTRGRLARQHPILRMGLGLDDISYSSWDVWPGLAALGKQLDDPKLEGLRRTARAWANAFMVQFFIGIALAISISALLAVNPLIPAATAFLSWGASQYVVFRHALWASRPEIREYQEFGARLYLVTGEVIVVTLVIAGVLVFVALQLWG